MLVGKWWLPWTGRPYFIAQHDLAHLEEVLQQLVRRYGFIHGKLIDKLHHRSEFVTDIEDLITAKIHELSETQER